MLTLFLQYPGARHMRMGRWESTKSRGIDRAVERNGDRTW